MRAAIRFGLSYKPRPENSSTSKRADSILAVLKKDTFQALKAGMDAARLDYEYLDRKEIQQRYPQFTLKEGMAGLFHADSGLLRASKCVLAHVRLAQARGAEILDEAPVVSIVPSENGAVVETAKGTFSCDRLILTTGSWAKGLLAEQGIDLPLKIMPCQLGFYQPNSVSDFVPGTFPVFFAHMNGSYGEMPYGIPHEDPEHRRKNHDLLWLEYRRVARRSRLHTEPSLD